MMRSILRYGRSTCVRLTLIMCLALGLRVIVLLWIGDSRVPWQLEYEEIADNLAARGQYAYSFYGLTASHPTSFLPPVYPLFLAFTRRFFPSPDQIAKIIQLCLSTLTLLSLYGLTREVGGSTDQATLAALLMAIYPPVIFYSVDLTTTALEILFGLSGIWLAIRMVRRNSARLAVAAGSLLSLAALTRSTWIVLIPLALLWAAWYHWRRWRQLIPFALSAVITLAPWGLYNYVTHGVLTITSTNGGLNFWIGNNPQATGEYVFPTDIDRSLIMSVADLPEVQQDRFFYERGWEFIRSSPARFIQLSSRKLWYYVFFRPNIGSNYESTALPLDLARWAFVAAWLMLLLFALLGVGALKSNWREHLWLFLIWLSQAGLAMVYFAGTRFRAPFDVLVIIWAAAGLLSVARRLRWA